MRALRMMRVGVAAAVVVGAGSAWAATGGGATASPRVDLVSIRSAGPGTVSAPQSDDDRPSQDALHDGSVARVHDGCAFPDSAEPSGNWTHGDFVSAWAHAMGGSVRDAAHSSCGKPITAHGPPDDGAVPGRGHSKGRSGGPSGS
jgi:hypothetical protein